MHFELLYRSDFGTAGYGKASADASLLCLKEHRIFSLWEPVPKLYDRFSGPVDIEDVLPAMKMLIEADDWY